jgi:hypothetical protein
VQHPSAADELVWVEPSLIRTFKWPVLEQQKQARSSSSHVTEMNEDVRLGRTSGPNPSTSRQTSRANEGRRTVQWATTAKSDDQHILVYATLPQERSVHWASDISQGGLELSTLQLSDLAGITTTSSSLLTPHLDTGLYVPTSNVPSALVEHIKFLTGMLGTSIVFLDHEGWLSTWDVTTRTKPEELGIPTRLAGTLHHHHNTVECDIEGVEGLTRHFFAPKDWLNTNTSHLTVVHGQGTLFCPRYGDVAIVRNGTRF